MLMVLFLPTSPTHSLMENFIPRFCYYVLLIYIINLPLKICFEIYILIVCNHYNYLYYSFK